MLRFFTPSVIGVEISSGYLRIGSISRNGEVAATSLSMQLPERLVSESYSSEPVADTGQLTDILRSAMKGHSLFKRRRIGLSLPDGMFRLQVLEFDDLPETTADRERLIRWRLEKSSAFDITDTVLRFNVWKLPTRGHAVLTAFAKKDLLDTFESMFSELGFEIWSITPSTFAILNFYAPYMTTKSYLYALVLLSAGSYSTIIIDDQIPRFYRYREIKTAGQEVVVRLTRELDDSLHFFAHKDRDGASEVGHLYVAGESGIVERLTDALKNRTTMEIERLSPRLFMPSLNDSQESLAAAFGAGRFS